MIRVLLLLLAFAGCARGEVRVIGDQRAKPEQIRGLLRASQSQTSFQQALTESYVREGFLAVSVVVDAARDTIVTISLGHRYVASDVLILGIDSNIVDRRALTDDRSPVTPAFIENLTRRVVEGYAEAGYPFCQAAVGSVDVLNGQLVLTYQIATGPLATFGKTEFTGLVATKPARLGRRLKLKRGLPYRESVLQQSQRTLARLDFTRPTGEPVVAHDTRDNAADIVFRMRDERNLTIDGLLFLNSDNSIGGSADLGLLNLLGSGERLSLHWSRVTASSHDFGLNVALPFVGGYPVDLHTSAAQSDRDSAYISGKLQLGAMYHATEQLAVGAVISWEKITPDEGRLSPSARIAGVTLTTSFQDRDDLRTTKRGVFLQTDFSSMYRKSFDQGSDVSTGYSTIIKARLELWQPLQRRWVAYQKLVPFQVRSDFAPIPTEQLFEIGGPQTLRGYRERGYLANLGVVSATELRYLFERDFLARLFCDNAYIETEAGMRKLTGLGIGMELETTLGRFRLDFSLGEKKQLDQMLVHFGFETGL